MTTASLLEVKDLTKTYRLPRTHLLRPPARVTALDNVSLTVASGETIGIVGESGSGKSTLARLVMALESPDAGSISYKGEVISNRRERQLRQFRREVQIVLQNPYTSLDPKLRVGRTISEPLRALRVPMDHTDRVAELLEAVGLSADARDRYPHEFSGGQRQRIALARALAPDPQVLIADEPTSALDVSVQAQVLNLLQDLRDTYGLTMILISHDLAIVNQISDRVAVVKDGQIVETKATGDLFSAADHPYTVRLLESMYALHG